MLVEACGVDDLVVAESATAHRYTLSVQVLRHGDPVDPVLRGEFVGRCPGAVSDHQAST